MQLQPRPTAGTLPAQRPSPTNRSTQPPAIPPTRSIPPKKSRTKKPIIIAIIAVILLGVVVAWQLLSSQIQSDKYQAVFLNNGQVYFGKLHGYYGSKPYMTEVHYFQANSQTAATESSSANQLLVKLGSEVHAPEGKIILNKDAIMFVENLTEESKVTEAIKKEAQSSDSSTNQSGTITR